MSFKDEIFDNLAGTAVYKIDVDREAVISGLPSTKVIVHRADGHAPHEFTFAKVNGMSAVQMAQVIRSYLPEMK